MFAKQILKLFIEYVFLDIRYHSDMYFVFWDEAMKVDISTRLKNVNLALCFKLWFQS